jgi:hypothetical protein
MGSKNGCAGERGLQAAGTGPYLKLATIPSRHRKARSCSLKAALLPAGIRW